MSQRCQQANFTEQTATIRPMGILQTLKSWFTAEQSTGTEDPATDTEETEPTATDDDELTLDPDGVRETRVETSEAVPDELDEITEATDTEESSSE